MKKLALLAFIFASLGIQAHAVSPDSGIINGCADKKTGNLRVVAKSMSCKNNEIPISWNQRGMQGEQGLPGPPGPKGDQGHSGVAGWETKVAALGSILAAFVALVALWIAQFKPRFDRPKLKAEFRKADADYCREVPDLLRKTGNRLAVLAIEGREYQMLRPFFNARIKIVNEGRTTARNVQARVEKIETSAGARYYHPTTIKWSGEFDWKPIDIVPHSYFFLDLFYSFNETLEAIDSLNCHTYEFEDGYLTCIIPEVITPSNQIAWNVWVKDPQYRGIPPYFVDEGNINIYINISGENCRPKGLTVQVQWDKYRWNDPAITIN
jgi:hypothetical protein